MVDENILGYRLSILRKESGLMQKEIAKKLGISAPTLSQYEKGGRSPDPNTLKQLADVYDVSVDYLLGRTNDRNKLYHSLIASDIRDIDDFLKDLENQVDIGLTFNGEPLDDESRARLQSNIRFATDIAKIESRKRHNNK